MRDINRYLKIVGDLKDEGKDAELIITSLKKEGAKQVETVKAIRQVFEISLAEADKLVLFSEAWKESRESTIKLRNTFFDAIESQDVDEE